MRDSLHNLFKVVGANVMSWMTTVLTIKLDDIHSVVTILAALGSLGVSIVSIIWIRKQTNHLGRGKTDPGE